MRALALQECLCRTSIPEASDKYCHPRFHSSFKCTAGERTTHSFSIVWIIGRAKMTADTALVSQASRSICQDQLGSDPRIDAVVLLLFSLLYRQKLFAPLLLT